MAPRFYAIALLLLCSGCNPMAQSNPQASPTMQAAPIDSIVALGRLEPEGEVIQLSVPISGQILRINTRVGEQVNTQQGIVELAQTDQMYAIAEIPESSIGKVKQGMAAKVSSEYGSFEGEIQGVVETVGLQVGRKGQQEAAGSTPKTDQNARVVVVKVRINLKKLLVLRTCR
jgi:HlyD family secretion protein